MATFELSSKKYKNGRRPFTATLYELQPPECVVDNIGTKYNKNGITFLEEYALPTLDSIKDMSVRVEFVDDERTLILGHGETGVSEGLPLFNNATTIGHFTEGFIKDIEIDGETKRCVCGKGFLDEMAYQPFIQSLEEQLNNGITVNGSVEIFRTSAHEGIVYLDGWHDKGRIPTEYIHSGWDMVINPADESSTLLELNNLKKESKKEEFKLDEKELKALIQTTISESNSKNDELTAKINELNSTITEKDAVIAEKESTIVELNATVEQVQKALDDLKKEHETYWAEKDALEKELGELKAKARIGELNSAIEKFSDEEKKFAEVEINSFNKKPLEGNIDMIVSKIYAGIGQASKKAADEAKVAEINSAKEEKGNEVVDIFSEICTEVHGDEEEDINIF